MSQDVIQYREKPVGPAMDLTASGSHEPGDQGPWTRNRIASLLAGGALLSLLAILFIGLWHHHKPAPAIAFAPSEATGFFIGAGGDSPERHGLSHEAALALSARFQVPFVAVRPGASWKWLSPQQAQRYLIRPRRMTLPVCTGDFLDPSHGIWKPAPGTPELAQRAKLIEQKGSRNFCARH